MSDDWIDIDFLALIRKRPTDWLKKAGQVPFLFAAVGVLHPEIEARAKYLYLLIFSRDYGVTGTMLCGAMPK